MSSIGANVHLMPLAVASRAATGSGLTRQVGVEGGGLGERGIRRDGAEAVQSTSRPNKERDLQARFEREFLEVV